MDVQVSVFTNWDLGLEAIDQSQVLKPLVRTFLPRTCSECDRVTEDGQLRCIVKDSLDIFQFSLHGLLKILKTIIPENHFANISSFLN